MFGDWEEYPLSPIQADKGIGPRIAGGAPISRNAAAGFVRCTCPPDGGTERRCCLVCGYPATRRCAIRIGARTSMSCRCSSQQWISNCLWIGSVLVGCLGFRVFPRRMLCCPEGASAALRTRLEKGGAPGRQAQVPPRNRSLAESDEESSRARHPTATARIRHRSREMTSQTLRHRTWGRASLGRGTLRVAQLPTVDSTYGR